MTAFAIRRLPRGVTLAAAMLLASGAPATPPADPPGPGPHGGPMAGVVRMMERLDLSPQQREQIGAILDEAMPAARRRLFAMIDARKALREAIEHEPLDEAALERAAHRVGELQGELIAVHARTQARIRAVLTPEQRARLEAQRPPRRGAGSGPGTGHRPPPPGPPR